MEKQQQHQKTIGDAEVTRELVKNEKAEVPAMQKMATFAFNSTFWRAGGPNQTFLKTLDFWWAASMPWLATHSEVQQRGPYHWRI